MVLYVRTQTDPYFFNFWRTLWIFLDFLFGRSKCRHRKSSLRRVFPTAFRKPLRFSDPHFAFLRPNIGFKPVLKLVTINLESSSSSFNSVLVDCFWLRQNAFHLTTLLNSLIVISMSAWTYFWDGYGTNRSEVPLHTRCTFLRRFLYWKHNIGPGPSKSWLRLIHN